MSNDYEDRQPAAEGRNGPSLFLIALIAVAGLTAAFVAQNRERTRIEFLWLDFTSRTWTAIAIAVALGVVLDRLVLAWWRRARRRKREG